MSNKEIKRVEQLNNAYFDIQNALKVIKFNVEENKESDLLFWRITKNLDALHKLILKRMKDEIMEEEFQNLTKMLQKPNE